MMTNVANMILKNVKASQIVCLRTLIGWTFSFLIFSTQVHGAIGSPGWRRVSQPPGQILPRSFQRGVGNLNYQWFQPSEGRDLYSNINSNNATELSRHESEYPQEQNSNSLSNNNGNMTSEDNSENEEYPSLQDFLERLSDVGYGYVIRDLLTAYITEDHEIETVLGDLGRVGLVALIIQTLGQYGNVTGIPEDKSRDLVRLSRYTGVGITLLGTYFDLYLLFDSIACVLRERRIKQVCLSGDNEIEGSEERDLKNIKNRLKSQVNFEHLSPADAEFCEWMQKQAEYGESLGLGPYLCRRSHPVIEIIAAAIATTADSITFATPQYGNLAALGEALYQILAYLYVAAEENGHFKKVGNEAVFNLGELGELIFRELKSLLTERREPLPGIPDWMPGEPNGHAHGHGH